MAGRLDEARTRAVQAVDLASQYQQRGDEARARGSLAKHRPARPPRGPAAARHYRQALALAEELGMRPLQAHCHRGLGTLYASKGSRNRRVPRSLPLSTLYRSMDMRFWLPQAETALAQMT